ncbi:TDT family transporter [Nguyenibacter sp. L1]|uniref:TDT family transporter n=1 Tax=Nguyenibacter sp. L1 TaxID=3049350 RepID=UPI002B491C96|nr:TDT family transporter [Nguyenibacter sp. L1]WRH86367.1 TDT family transporter [Nguyenibacter sp. L1]
MSAQFPTLPRRACDDDSYPVIRRFTPNWFAVTMGTGVLGLALHQAPFRTAAIEVVSTALWGVAGLLWLLFAGLYAARWVLYRHEARRIFDHPVMATFLGTIPMGLATVIGGLLAFGVPCWGQGAVDAAVALWWCDAALSVAVGIGIPLAMIVRQDHTLPTMTGVWLLPIVAAEVAAATAGALLPHLSDPAAAWRMLILSYALWAFSVPLACSVLAILVLRLMLHKLPPREMAASGWLALGPLGTGALGLLALGQDAPAICNANGMAALGPVAAGAGIIGGTILWGYGAWWLMFGVATALRYLRQGLPFNLGCWGFTFPLGVYALATLTLARQTHLALLAVFGGVLVVGLAVVWAIVAAHTLRGAWRRTLFVAPCLGLP